MLGYPFYHGHIRRLIAAFGSLFDDIKVATVDETGRITRAMTVPLRYAGMDKTLSEPDPTAKPFNEVYPRMSFELLQISYDPEKKINPHNVIGGVSAPTPYVVDFGLYILARSMGDALQILEQILPYFNPTLTITMQNSPIKNNIEDIPITLTGTSFSDVYEGDEHVARRVEITINFSATVNLYKSSGTAYENKLKEFICDNYKPDDPNSCTPPKEPLVDPKSGKVIYKVITDIFADTDAFCARINENPLDDYKAIPDSTVVVEATAKEIYDYESRK